jgi:hypothetical protein
MSRSAGRGRRPASRPTLEIEVTMLATTAPNIFYVIGLPILSMVVVGLISVALYKALGGLFPS